MNNPLHVTNLLINAVTAASAWWYYRLSSYLISNRYSTFSRRLWSGPVDGCVLWPLDTAALLLVGSNPPRAIGLLGLLVQQLGWFAYTVLMHGKYGQTVGKMTTMVRAFDVRTETPISYRQAHLREGIPAAASAPFLIHEFVGVMQGKASTTLVAEGKRSHDSGLSCFAALPLLWFLAEILTMLTNGKRRALHDFIAGTAVIRTNANEPG
jgi:uncharacterized RDD family membrane protein YckC